MDAELNRWKTTEIKRCLAKMVEEGDLSDAVVEAVCVRGYCAPIECEFFDYKLTTSKDKLDSIKLVRNCVAMFNTFGGYLLFGVRETVSETEFRVEGVPEDLIDVEALKARLKEYTGVRIQINGRCQSVENHDGRAVTLFLLQIPKRHIDDHPVPFIKDGVGDPSAQNRPLFRRDEIHCRAADETIEAKGTQVIRLLGPRLNPYLMETSASRLLSLSKARIQNNLPDRNAICPRFVGRAEIIDSLYRWLADDLSYVRLLAGEGGLGKSSIAFEFAEMLSTDSDSPFYQIIWLSAKRFQFVPMRDEFVATPETHYDSYQTLLVAISERLALTVDDIGDSPTIESLRRFIKIGLTHIPSLLVVDDIDSLSPEEQKKTYELGMWLSGTKSRVLLTTRNNVSYSHDVAIAVSGFSELDYADYMQTLCERRLLAEMPSVEQRKKLFAVTEGSPLFTESLCRLLRYQPFPQAVKSWEGTDGTRVRAAALDREIEQLAPEAKRVLLATALLVEASVPELASATEYPEETVLRGIDQLTSLFLVSEDAIAGIARFRVPDNTVRLVLEKKSRLVSDFRRIEEETSKLRQEKNLPAGRDGRVALAISQARALEGQGDFENALKTITDASNRAKANGDLQAFHAEFLMRRMPEKFDHARRLAADAFKRGSRRPTLFDAWFTAEFEAKHYVGAEDAAKAAVESNCRGKPEWLAKLALAKVFKAEARGLRGYDDQGIGTLHEASDVLKDAIALAPNLDSKGWEGALFDVHDKLWELVSSDVRLLDQTEIALQTLERMWARGDTRYGNSRRAVRVVEAIGDYISLPLAKRSEREMDRARGQVGRCIDLIQHRTQKFPGDTRNADITDELGRTRDRYSRAFGNS